MCLCLRFQALTLNIIPRVGCFLVHFVHLELLTVSGRIQIARRKVGQTLVDYHLMGRGNVHFIGFQTFFLILNSFGCIRLQG